MERRTNIPNGTPQNTPNTVRNGGTLDREATLKQLQALGFAIWETVLYLDGHPNNTRALEYYQTKMEEYRDLRNRYEETYGTLSPMAMGPTSRTWTWVKNPWPWEEMNHTDLGGN